MRIPYFFEDLRVRIGHGSGTARDPGPHAIGGFIHCGKWRASQEVMHKSSGERIARSDRVLNACSETCVFVRRVRRNQ